MPRWQRKASNVTKAALALLPAGQAGLAVKVAMGLVLVFWWTSGPGAKEQRYRHPSSSCPNSSCYRCGDLALMDASLIDILSGACFRIKVHVHPHLMLFVIECVHFDKPCPSICGTIHLSQSAVGNPQLALAKITSLSHWYPHELS